MNLDQEVKEGNRAKNILEDPVFKDAYDSIEENIIHQLKRCDLADLERMRALVATFQAHCEGRKQLERTMETGQLAEAQVSK